MITLNTIVKRFEDFADNHFFIRSFSFGGPEDVDLEKFDQYPLLHLIYTGATYEDTTKTLDFEVYIFDLPSAYEDKNERQKEVVSDAEQCAEDILADIANGQNIFIDSEDYEIANASVTPLQEANSNVLAGVLLELSITLPYDRSACDAPINGVQPEGGGFVYQRRGLLRVLTQNGAVDVLSVNTIKVTNGTLTDEGNGVVSIDTGGGGAENLDDLADVIITDPLDHDSLIYDEVTGDWINGAPKALDMPVFNGSGAIISKGALCKAIGTQGDRVSVGLFDLDVDDPKVLVGLATAQLAIAGTGHVRTYGELRGLTTNAYAVGTILYASGTPGVLSSTAGSPELAIAIVTRSQTPTGRLFIRSWTPNSGKAFRYITVGATTIEAEKQEDTLTLTAGTGISLTPDAGTDAVTIASTVTAPNTFSTIAVATQSPVVADSTTDTLTLAAGTGITITTDASTDTVTITNSATGANAFGNVAVSGQTPVAADSTNDTLTLVAGTNITLTTDAVTDSITIAASGGGGNSFGTIAVATQSDVVADSGNDTLTFAVAGGMAITTNATTDTITFDSKYLDFDDVTLQGARLIDMNGDSLTLQDSTFLHPVAVFTSDSVDLREVTIRAMDNGSAGYISLMEAVNNGTNGIRLQAPTNLATSPTFTLPGADGTSNQVMQTNGSGGLSFVTKKATQVTGKTVLTGAWSLVSGVYEASISDAAILSTSIVNVIPNNADAATIRTAGLLPRTDSSAGAVKIYSTSAPAASITVTLNIFDL